MTDPSSDNDVRIYPCDVCDDCWGKHYPLKIASTRGSRVLEPSSEQTT